MQQLIHARRTERNATQNAPQPQGATTTTTTTTTATSTRLSERAMLADITIKAWAGRKHDKTITTEIHRSKNAEADAGRYAKNLIAPHALKPLSAAASALRAEHYKRTLPWQDDGSRILSSQGYLEYTAAIAPLKATYLAAADNFAQIYPTLIREAQRRLGSMFDPNEYPNPNVIRSKFDVQTNILPLPDANDFRASLPPDVLENLRDEINQQVHATIQEAQADIFHRAKDVLMHLHDKLTNYKPPTASSKAEGIFRDSLVTNVRELATLIPSLDVTRDTTTTTLFRDLIELSDTQPDTLRVSDQARNDTIRQAKKILDTIDGYLA